MKQTGNSFLLFYCVFSFSVLVSCGDSSELKNNSIDTLLTEKIQVEEDSADDMSDPALMLGSNIGSLMRSYYSIGDFDQMLVFTSAMTIEKFGRDSLKMYYRNLDLRMEMKLLSITEEPPFQILHYECIDKATKIIRRLPVVIENDTARVAPPFPNKGTLFELGN
jgi:hypothetical protein